MKDLQDMEATALPQGAGPEGRRQLWHFFDLIEKRGWAHDFRQDRGDRHGGEG